MLYTAIRRGGLLVATAATALVLAACGSSDGNGNMPDMGGNASKGAAAFNDTDVMFAQMMIPHHQQAVEMATLAETRAADAEVKTLAGRIKAAQAPEIQQLTTFLTGWAKPTTVPSDMGHGGMPGMMSDGDMTTLKAATGREFDKKFCTMMIAHHQGAIEMAKEEIAKGANPEAKALAQAIVTAQQKEIDQMNKLVARL